MHLHRISAVPVMEGERCVANLSVSDLRGVTGDREALGSLLLPALESGIHRIWIRDPATPTGSGEAPRKPIDVVTMTDILAFLLPSDSFFKSG
ncbi:hypothetical protein HDU67_007093 [Dinochytrium kinnereticum]|nr:hypothetical protein HDU67_007093 [Dinochytrium kinnereticum]